MSRRRQRRAAETAAEAAALAEEAMLVWRVQSWYRRGSEPVYGAPLRCPDCGAFSLVLKVDRREGRCRNRCTECNEVFTITERAMEAVLSGRLARPAGLRLPGDGQPEPEPDRRPTESVFGGAPARSEAGTTGVRQVAWTPPILEPPVPPDELPPLGEPMTPAAMEPPAAAAPDLAPLAQAPPPPDLAPLAQAPPPPDLPAPPLVEAPPPPAEAAPPPPLPAPPEPTPAVAGPVTSGTRSDRSSDDDHRSTAAARAAEAGRRNRRRAAAARRSRAAQAAAESPPDAAPVDAPDPADPWDAPPVPAERSTGPRSSLFSAPAPRAPAEDDDDGGLQTVVVGGRLVGGDEALPPAPEPADPVPVAASTTPPPSAEPAEPPADAGRPPFGAVVVSRLSGDEAYLIDPTGGAAAVPVLTAAGPPLGGGGADEPGTGAPGGGDGHPTGGSLPSLPSREQREALRVLMVEDDPADAALARTLLGAAGADAVDLRVATSRRAGMEAAHEFEPHVVLLDLDLPDSHGLATITRWCFSDLPGAVVVMSGDYSEAIEQQGREQGVAEFVSKRLLTEWLERGEDGVAEAMELLGSVATGR